MPGTFQLAKFAVVVWVRKTAGYQAIHDALLELAGEDPDESTEYQGMVDYHWGFEGMAEADRLANALREFAENQRSSSCASRAETMQFRPKH